jgi:hypothetical protein
MDGFPLRDSLIQHAYPQRRKSLPSTSFQADHPGRSRLDDPGRSECAEEDHGDLLEDHSILSRLQLCYQVSCFDL